MAPKSHQAYLLHMNTELMTGQQLKALRQAYGLSASAMGRLLGYNGTSRNIGVHVRRLERNVRPIPPPVARLAYMFSYFGFPEEWEL
jgi:transcriptional regulator with XRE-family HTH domain